MEEELLAFLSVGYDGSPMLKMQMSEWELLPQEQWNTQCQYVAKLYALPPKYYLNTIPPVVQ